MNISENDTSILMDYLINNPEKQEQLITKLNNQADDLTNSDNYSGNNNTENMFGTINIIQDGKSWLLFDNYIFDIVPGYITLSIENEEIDLYINDEQVTTSSEEDYEETFGPFIPGTHKVKASYENQYTTAEIEDEVILFQMTEDTQHLSLELPITEVSVNSLYDDYKLYINDEETDITINEGSSASIGIFPIDSNTSVHMQKAYPWGTLKSEESVIASDTIKFDTINTLSEDEQIELMEHLNAVVSQYHKALTEQDPSARIIIGQPK